MVPMIGRVSGVLKESASGMGEDEVTSVVIYTRHPESYQNQAFLCFENDPEITVNAY